MIDRLTSKVEADIAQRVDRSSYYSPFGKILDYELAFEKQGYDGTMMQVLDELQAQLVLRRREANPVILALHPPRIMRGVMDYFIQTQRENGKVYLLRKAVRLALALSNNLETSRYLRKFGRAVVNSGHGDLLKFPVSQIPDRPAWDSTRPDRSRRSAEALLGQARGRDLLFIPLGHGGVAAGLDVFEYYRKLTRTKGSLFYPVRCSMKKKHDRQPRASQEEVKFLRQAAVGRVPVVFDEDVITGETIMNAYEFFRGILEVEGRTLLQLTNLNMKVQVSEN